MQIRKTLFACTLASIAIAACQKDNSPASQSAEAILTTGKWQVSDATVTLPGSSLTLDVYDSIPTCIRDNFYTFAADGTATIDEGATKCDDSSPQTISGNWKLLNNNTQLQTIDPITSANATLTLLEINSTDMKIADTLTYMGFKVNGTVTLKHSN